MKDVILLADKNSNAWGFAEKIQSHIRSSYHEKVSLYDLPLSKFRNGEIQFGSTKNLRKKDIYFVQDSSKNPQDWWTEILLTKDMVNSSSARSLALVLPNMMYSRQDRKDKSRVPISARALADSISPGTNKIITMDLHSSQIQGFYPATTPLDNIPSFPPVVHYLKENHAEYLENLLIVSPDSGGVSRASSFLRKIQESSPENFDLDIGFMSKKRKKAGEVENMRYSGASPKGRNILMIDDILDSGNTLIKAADMLRGMGANTIFAYCTHGLFTEGLKNLSKSLDKIIVSNTHHQTLEGVDVVDVSPLFGEAIFRAQKGHSISDLFKIKA